MLQKRVREGMQGQSGQCGSASPRKSPAAGSSCCAGGPRMHATLHVCQSHSCQLPFPPSFFWQEQSTPTSF
eukprot:1027204-Pelagomonas_calceolata.AAC.4